MTRSKTLQTHGFPVLAFLSAMALAGTPAPATAGSTIYDLTVFLDAGPAEQPSGGAASASVPSAHAVQTADALSLVPPPPPESETDRAVRSAEFTSGVSVALSDTQIAEAAAMHAATGAKSDSGARRADLSLSDGIVSEVRLGFAAHDVGPFTLDTQREDGSVNLNAEVLFHSPDILSVVGSPRPHLGTQVNLSGETSQVYAGLSYEWYLVDQVFVGIHGGGAYHNGETTGSRTRKNLGCNTLFRGAVEAGYRFGDRQSLSVMVDHISNANLCDANEGLETIVVRYGYRF